MGMEWQSAKRSRFWVIKRVSRQGQVSRRCRQEDHRHQRMATSLSKPSVHSRCRRGQDGSSAARYLRAMHSQRQSTASGKTKPFAMPQVVIVRVEVDAGGRRWTLKRLRRSLVFARLELSETDPAKMAAQLTAILSYVDQLKELNTDNVEPMAHPLPLQNVFRADEPAGSLPVGEVLKMLLCASAISLASRPFSILNLIECHD